MANPADGRRGMTPVRSFQDLTARLAACPPARLAVAGGGDGQVMAAVIMALEAGLVRSAIVTGAMSDIVPLVPAHHRDAITIHPAASAQDCAARAVAAIRDGAAEILMKGHVDSTAYLRAIVDKATGIRGDGVLSNVTVAEMASYPKLLAVTDNGILPAPDLAQKHQILLNCRTLFAGLGIAPIKVAAIAATEKPSDRIPATRDAEALARASAAGHLPDLIVDGPFGYDVAVSRDAAQRKGLAASKVAGMADLILCPDINTGNALAKSWKLHGQARTGSIVLGARAPVLLNSRSDCAERRLNALLLALATRAGAKRGPAISQSERSVTS